MFKRPKLHNERLRLIYIILDLLVLFTGIFLFISLISDLLKPVHWGTFGLAFAFSWTLKILSYRPKRLFWVSNGIIFTIYATLELVLFLQPATLHTILYWSIAPPLIGSLILKRTNTYFWAALGLITSLINIYYALHTGPEVLQIGLNENLIESLIFYVVLCLCLFFFLQLQLNARTNLKTKNRELVELHNEIQSQNEELQQQHEQISTQRDFITQKNESLGNFLEIIVALGSSQNINFGNLEQAEIEICEAAASSLGVSRVSIWSYQADQQSLVCKLLHADGRFQKINTEAIEYKDNPTYFDTIRNTGLVMADLARSSDDMSVLNQKYHIPNQIYSLLDSAYLVDGDFGGVICCEQTHAPRSWTLEDTLVIKVLGNLLTLAHKTRQHTDKNRQLEEKSQEIAELNEHLEEKIAERTSELEKKNLQLTEYAFVNSHLLRGPIARIAGLYYLLESQHPSLKGDMIFGYLKDSINELDKVSKSINKAIEDNSDTPKTP
ncbi:hypothetical protein QWY31_01980 [Cytophagales bacterium LB-30]|uniref:GAF domain-containing protein n=2 Tax=Shiella aurantiaca TaxID=3058365 RepID=A0ABT8F1C6_9BACT|nr:hypothetical protein [Shiella aurantiaca]